MLQVQSAVNPDPEVLNVLLYGRVSTDRQFEEGHSLDDQITRLVKYARDHHYHILGIYRDEGKSACSTTGRPDFTRMLERCQTDKEVNAILLEETDRFARNAQDHLAVKALLKKYNVKLIATQQPNFGDDPVGNFVDLVMAGANQLQREITGVKTKRTMIALAERGLQPGVSVLGYLNSFEKNVPWKIDRARAYFIKEIFRRYLQGAHSIDDLERELYAEGFRTKQGKMVHASAIHRILNDYRYCGKVKYMGNIYDGQHKPLISLSDMERARKLMDKRNKGADRSRKYSWLLSGTAFCGQCGGLMSGEIHTKPNGTEFKYYRCIGSKSHGKSCGQPYAPVNEIHHQLERHITGIKFGKRFFNALRLELTDLIDHKDTSIPARIKELKDRKKAIEAKMDRLEDQMIADTIPEDRIKVKYTPLKAELKGIETQLEKLSKPSVNMDQTKVEKIVAYLKQLPQLYAAFTPEERRQFLTWFVSKVKIKDKNIEAIEYTEAFQAVITRDLVRITNTWLPG